MFTPLDSFHSSAGLAPAGEVQFKRMLHQIWFKLHARSNERDFLTTSNFEHIFMGEVSNTSG